MQLCNYTLLYNITLDTLNQIYRLSKLKQFVYDKQVLPQVAHYIQGFQTTSYILLVGERRSALYGHHAIQNLCSNQRQAGKKFDADTRRPYSSYTE